MAKAVPGLTHLFAKDKVCVLIILLLKFSSVLWAFENDTTSELDCFGICFRLSDQRRSLIMVH